MSGELAFFEIGVGDVERGRAFYTELFGWTFESGPHGGYGIATPTIRGGIHGGDPGVPPYVFFKVDDIDKAADRVVALGGTVEDLDGEAADDSTATFGRFRLCRDDQGSSFGLHEPPRG